MKDSVSAPGKDKYMIPLIPAVCPSSMGRAKEEAKAFALAASHCQSKKNIFSATFASLR